MRRLRRFLALPGPERRLLVTAALLLSIVRLGLCALSFQTVRHLLGLLARLPRRVNTRPLPPERVAWAMAVAARHTPGTWTCLVQALALQLLLRRHGHTAELRLGVARLASGEFAAHAWVECAGQIVAGDAERAEFTALPPLAGARP